MIKKELSIEDKAKHYDEAIKRARQIHDADRVSGIELTTCEEIFPELKESEGEIIRSFLIDFIKACSWTEKKDQGWPLREECIAWLEKKDKQNPAEEIEPTPIFRIGDVLKRKDKDYTFRVDRIQGGYYHCDRNHGAFFPIEEQDNWELVEQKPTDKVEPKFKVGDWIVFNGLILHIDEIVNGYYRTTSIGGIHNSYDWDIDNVARLWSIQDAKPGDVLACESGWACIFKALDNHTNTFSSYCFMDKDKWFCNTGSECHTLDKAFIKAYNGEIHPATKEQRDTLLKAMANAGYTFDFDKKELKKIIDEKQIKKNLQDNSFRRMFEQKPAWSKEDERYLSYAIYAVEDMLGNNGKNTANWLKSLRPQNRWKPSDEQMEALKGVQEGVFRLGILESLYQDLKKLKE